MLFQSHGVTQYTGTTYVGFVGLVTGARFNAVSISVDERDQGHWWQNALAALLSRRATPLSFLVRDVLATPEVTFDEAVHRLAYTPLVAPVYLIVGGVRPGEGAVITRDRVAAIDIWRLDDELRRGQWWLLETNYDHWAPPPPGDDRRDPGNRAMRALGQSGVGPAGLYRVLSVAPVLNQNTTYTTVMSAMLPGVYWTRIRWPPPPLVP